MALDPINRKMTMKKVAGFHSVDFGAFEIVDGMVFRSRINLGTMECQTVGLATRGSWSDVELKREATLTGNLDLDIRVTVRVLACRLVGYGRRSITASQ